VQGPPTRSTVRGAMSELQWEAEPNLDRPILVIALAGFFDAGAAATGATSWLVRQLHAEPLARMDPEVFFDFQRARPRVELTDDGSRRIVWPELVAHAARGGEGGHDLIVLAGIEPHLRWRTFTETVGELAAHTRTEMIVTLGASPAQSPHTRPPLVFSSSTNDQLAARLGLRRPQYQGVTGALGVLHARLDTTGPPAIAMRVDVPHYAATENDPKATMALLHHVEHVTGVQTGHASMAAEVARWEQRLDAAVEDDPAARAYVRQLEARYDRQTEHELDSGQDLAAELERFLREQRGEE
jgi:proteasome assembly chaperone (PAC2) family protein